MRKIVVISTLVTVMLGMFGIISAQADPVVNIAKGCGIVNSGTCVFNVTGSQFRGVGGTWNGSAKITHLDWCRLSYPDGPFCLDANGQPYKIIFTDWSASNLAGSTCTKIPFWSPGCTNKPANFDLKDGIDYTLTCTGCVGFIAAGTIEP